LLKAAGTPIDHYSYEAVELLKDTSARWNALRKIRDSAAMKTNTDPAIAALMKVPNAEIYTIDVSFKQIKSEEERFYLNQQPTSFVLTDEAVDRLRASAGKIIMASPEFQRLIKDVGVRITQKND
jgi:NTE family protein